MNADVAIHFLIGLAGMGAGCCARYLCRHYMAKALLVTGLLWAEAMVSVALVG